MNSEIQIDLVRLADGSRLLRLTDAASRLARPVRNPCSGRSSMASRLPPPALTRSHRQRGMKEEEMMAIADFIHRALTAREDATAIAKIREEVHAFSRKFPLPF